MARSAIKWVDKPELTEAEMDEEHRRGQLHHLVGNRHSLRGNDGRFISRDDVSDGEAEEEAERTLQGRGYDETPFVEAGDFEDDNSPDPLQALSRIRKNDRRFQKDKDEVPLVRVIAWGKVMTPEYAALLLYHDTDPSPQVRIFHDGQVFSPEQAAEHLDCDMYG